MLTARLYGPGVGEYVAIAHLVLDIKIEEQKQFKMEILGSIHCMHRK